jgi:hypothetical protein
MEKSKKNICGFLVRVMAVFAVTLFTSGCSTLGGIADVIAGRSNQKITRTPIWVYKPDLRMRVGGQNGDVFKNGTGTSVLPLSGHRQVEVWSMVDIDRVEISTCSRHDVCQKKSGPLGCNEERFTVPTDWWGNPGKYMLYKFEPDQKERSDSCANALIAVYDKNTLAAWSYLVFRVNTENTFQSVMTCNASDIAFDGVSVCAAKAGTIQQIRFQEPIDNFKSEPSCNLKKIDEGVFDIQPAVGWCRASFGSGRKYHDLIVNGYDEVLIREK